jgi:hypothetical protein
MISTSTRTSGLIGPDDLQHDGWVAFANTRVATMSALLRMADSSRTSRHVSKVPDSDIARGASGLLIDGET